MSASITAPLGPNEKAWVTFQARAALAGHTTTRDASGWITVSRWGRTISFEHVGTASAWLNRVTGCAVPTPGSVEV